MIGHLTHKIFTFLLLEFHFFYIQIYYTVKEII